MRVLVTGATTPLGAELVRELLADPSVEHVLAVSLDPPPPRSERLTSLAVDLTRSRAVHDLVHGPARELGIDAIVHGALHRSVRDQGARVHAANVETTRQLFLACEGQQTIRRFVLRSVAEVYAIRSTDPNLLDEDAPLELEPGTAQWVRDRVEADVTACARMGMSSLSIAVLRCAEVLAPGTGSQLHDYLGSRVCFRPLGFNPMINVLSIPDWVRAVRLGLQGRAPGVFNIPGADTLPLSEIIARWGRLEIPVPGPLLAPLYRWRARTVGFEFRYDQNFRRFHFGAVLDGTRAARELGYRPQQTTGWPDAVGAHAARHLHHSRA